MEPHNVTHYRRLGQDELTSADRQLLIDIHAAAFGDEMQDPFHQRFPWFVDHWSERPGFVCVIGYDGETAIGFAYGAPAVVGREWWRPHWVPESGETGTFHVSELAVLPRARKTGAGQRLHDELLRGRQEMLAALLVDTTHVRMVAHYQQWGYLGVGAERQFPDSPMYEVMVKRLEGEGPK